MSSLIRAIDEQLIPRLRRWSIPLLRYSLSAVFIWFGLLKIAGTSPVEDLVQATVYWIEGDWLVPALGFLEVFIGVGLALGKPIRTVLLLLVVQIAGTFLVFIVLPDVTFDQGNPFDLTTEGEFIIKNLVLLSAAMVVGSAIQPGEVLGAEELAPKEPTSG